MELKAPIIVDLNQVDFAAKKGLRIDVEKLSEALGVPVVPTVAVTGSGIDEMLSTVIGIISGEKKSKPLKVRYGKEIEKGVKALEKLVSDKLPQLCTVYNARWIAVKLLERDMDVSGKLKNHENGEEILNRAEKLAAELEKIHGEASPVVMASDEEGRLIKVKPDSRDNQDEFRGRKFESDTNIIDVVLPSGSRQKDVLGANRRGRAIELPALRKQ